MRWLVVTCLAGCLGTPARPSEGSRDAGTDGGGDAAPACTFGAWGPPGAVDLGTNTGDQGGPWLSPDGLDLWFDEDTGNGGRIAHGHRASRATRTFTGIADSGLTGEIYDPWLSSDQKRMWHEVWGADGDVMFAERATTTSLFNDKVQVSLGDAANHNEAGPSLTDDELEVVFMSGIGGTADDSRRIYTARRAMATDAFGVQLPFDPPVKLVELDGLEPDYAPTISADGLTLFWTRGITGSERIMTATRADRASPWSSSVFTPTMDGQPSSEPFLSRDGTTFMYSRYDVTKSNWDVYMMERPCTP